MSESTKQKTKTEAELQTQAREDYTGKDIEVVEGLDHVRVHPSMYIGSKGVEGLHHLMEEVLNNSVDEAIGNFAKNVWVILNDDSSITIKDDGRGIPVDEHPKEKKPALEVILTTMGAGGKFSGKAYAISGGLHGMGVSIVNACSKEMTVSSYRQGYEWTQSFEQGVPTGPLKKGKKTTKLGTDITFLYDDEVLEKDLKFSYEKIVLRLQEFSYLVAGLKLHLFAPEHEDKVFQSEEGLKDYVQHLIAAREKIKPVHKKVLYLKSDEVEVALQWTDYTREQWLAFTNCINNVDGGTHVSGLRGAVTRTMNNYAAQLGKAGGNKEPLAGEDVREGLFSVISVKVSDPQFEAQTKIKLNNPETKQIVEKFVSEELEKWLVANDKEAKLILSRCLVARDGRLAAQKAKQAVSKRKGLLGGDNTLPGKLSDCSSEDPEITELFICEGDSAAGTGKAGRDPSFQAILPLRGKPINAEKEKAGKVWENNEIRDIVTAIGGTITGTGQKLYVEVDQFRYSKILILADADVDGKHIITLLLTFFYREIPQLIKEKRLYVAIPPLYAVQHKTKGKMFLYNEEDLQEMAKKKEIKLLNGEADVQRFKGLGEMNADQLRKTLMAPETRVVRPVMVSDAAEAEAIVALLMGKNVPNRRAFIMENALDVEVLD